MLRDDEIILKPMIFSEKANGLKDSHNQFLFLVHPAANKIEIGRAVERLFNVKVTKIRTLMTRGHLGRMGQRFGKHPNRKKAIITLEEGQKIEIFG